MSLTVHYWALSVPNCALSWQCLPNDLLQVTGATSHPSTSQHRLHQVVQGLGESGWRWGDGIFGWGRSEWGEDRAQEGVESVVAAYATSKFPSRAMKPYTWLSRFASSIQMYLGIHLFGTIIKYIIKWWHYVAYFSFLKVWRQHNSIFVIYMKCQKRPTSWTWRFTYPYKIPSISHFCITLRHPECSLSVSFVLVMGLLIALPLKVSVQGMETKCIDRPIQLC